MRVLSSSKNLVSSLLRRHPFSGIILLVLTGVLLFLVVQFAYEHYQEPVFILFSEDELNPNASGQTPYNLEEILEID